MLKLIKNLFVKKEIPIEKIEFSELNTWLDKNTGHLFEKLDSAISEIIKLIGKEKEDVLGNIEKLENAKLQNPNIPDRAKTVMEGNRKAFAKKVSHFFNNIDLKSGDYKEAIRNCSHLENEIETLAKSTARSYQILNEFFAREAGTVAKNIKNVENYLKDIKNAVKDNKIDSVEKIKKDIENVNVKINLRKQLLGELEELEGSIKNVKDSILSIEDKIKGIKSGEYHNNYENLLKEKEKLEHEIKKIEDNLFHDFSILERAFKKYSKIAVEKEELINEYLKSPVNALAKDINLEIINVINNLKSAIRDDKLGLDNKKSEKLLIKLKELDKEYFLGLQKNYNEIKDKLNSVNIDIGKNNVKKDIELADKELIKEKMHLGSLDNNLSIIKNDFEKIDIGKLKKEVEENVNKLGFRVEFG